MYDVIKNICEGIKNMVSNMFDTVKEIRSMCKTISSYTCEGYSYKLVTKDGTWLFPEECYRHVQDDRCLDEFQSPVNIMVGDLIRVVSDSWDVGVAVVKQRVYNASYHCIYLVCERVTEDPDYIYTDAFKDRMLSLFDKIKAGIENRADEPKYYLKDDREKLQETISNVSKSLRDVTTVSYPILRDYVEKLIYEHLELPLESKVMLDY
jgi:hypothetical protein